ncbi:hypothetical protein ACFWBI_34675 [Streptomyces sp. NPDC059982]|uniref:hypothetical protein n=1 Tax=unclassified Streptomyces TaxID=2593676 RepID=UPI0036BFF700
MATEGWSVKVRDVQSSEKIKESAGTRFTVPEGRVLVGRSHQGDENGDTRYHHAVLVVVTPQGEYSTTVGKASWSEGRREAGSEYTAARGRFMTGRYHAGDENGPTEYETAEVSVRINGAEHRLSFTAGEWVEAGKEMSHDALAPEGQVLVGRKHVGDEAGPTSHRFATPSV